MNTIAIIFSYILLISSNADWTMFMFDENKTNVQYFQNVSAPDPLLITINGTRYKASEFKQRLVEWQGSMQALRLIEGYGNRGRKNIDSDYQKFLRMIGNGEIVSIDFTADGGFNIQYKNNNQQIFAPSDKYSSDYIATAIRNNIWGLNEYIPSQVENNSTDTYIIEWDPEKMLIKTIWGGEIDPRLYKMMNYNQRINDVIKTLKKYRGEFLLYFLYPVKSHYKVIGIMPCSTIEEYDQFIEDISTYSDDDYQQINGKFIKDSSGNRILKPEIKSTWSYDEVLKYRKFGPFFYDYVMGTLHVE